MRRYNTKYEEPMNASELAFLLEKEHKERATFFRLVRNLTFIFIVTPCCIGIIMESLKRYRETPEMRIVSEREDPHAILTYFIGMLTLLMLAAICSFFFYRKGLWKLTKDRKRQFKTIEQTTIQRKQFVEPNNSYHFYLNSNTLLSIEVSKEDYTSFQEEDEINIEYSSYSKVYFGYF